MTVRTDITVDWTLSPRIIHIPITSTSINMQDLVDTIRNHEAEGINASYPYIVKASGKEDLGDGVLVGITLELQNTKIKFADRLGPDWVICNVMGGNLVAVDDVGVSMDSIQTSDYVTIVKTSSSSATIATLNIDNLQIMIEELQEDTADMLQIHSEVLVMD